MLNYEEISMLVKEENLQKIVDAINTKQINEESLYYFINMVISLSSPFSNLLLDTPAFVALLFEAEQLRRINLGDFVVEVMRYGREATSFKLLSICSANLSEYNCMRLLEIASERGMTAAAKLLLQNPKVYDAMFKEAKQYKEPPLPKAFSLAAKNGKSEIVALFLPYIMKIGTYSKYALSSVISDAQSQQKKFPAVVQLMHSLPQVQAIEDQKKFSECAAEKDIAGIKKLIADGFNDIDTMYSALLKSIEIDDCPTFEYLLSVSSLREHAIKLANVQSTDGALHGDRWSYRLGSNCIDSAAKYCRIQMLEKFVEIDANAVSNSGALYHAVTGDKVDHSTVDLLLARTKFKVSRGMMYAISRLLAIGDNNTLNRIFEKFAADAINQDQVNSVMLAIVSAVIEDAMYYPENAHKILPIFEFSRVKTAIDADNQCLVLKQLIQSSRAFDGTFLYRMFNYYFESGKVNLEAKNSNTLLYLAISNQQARIVDALLTIPDVVVLLKNNLDNYIGLAESNLKLASKYATPEVIETLKKHADSDTEIKARQSCLDDAQYIANQIKGAIAEKVDDVVRKNKRLSVKL